ncbi:hypothetical protein HO133_005847 [Letharia lupina]|uniref:Uncharacterized protein n=1 Tax=Letharia lupina TaxID=560253 RepID=A0A8H6C834_9LECA|nr:uncharacterized protein HO133_005847 [Letharia lupina]KAF6218498.1 hypothetical protein HO133_005847 [Letharia lupina]
MDSPNLQRLRSIATESQLTVNNYLENPSDRVARVKALRDAKNLVTELQDGDDAFFDRIAQVYAAQALRFTMAIGAFEKIPRKGSITAATLAAEVGSEKTLINGMLDEVEQDEYAHTIRSINFLEPGYGYFFEVM